MSTPDKIEAAAARWLARREAGPLKEADEEAFAQWCAEDSRHLGAYVRLEAVSARFDRAAALTGMVAEKPARRWLAAVAAAVALMIVGAWAWTARPPATETRELATNIGEQYRSALSDGSVLELNTATEVAVAMDANVRRIQLAKGEALFDVAHDKQRPFVVKTGLADVRAVGTVFSVRVDDGLSVAVTEGVVEVEKEGVLISRISAGETFALKSSGDTARRGGQTEEIERALAWRDGKVAFAGATLAEAAAELNRYNKVQIDIADADAAALRFGGYFRATDPDSFATALEKSLPVKAERRGERIVITARPPA